MKNIKNKLFFAINVFIMFLIVGMIIANDIKVDASSEIQVTFTESELGKESFSYTVDEVLVESNGGSLPKGTKIKLNAEPNDNARFYFWVYYLDGKPMKLSDSPSVSVVVNQNYEFTAVYASENQVVATGELVIINDRYGVRIDNIKKEKETAKAPKVASKEEKTQQATPKTQKAKPQQAKSQQENDDENFDYSDFEIEDESI